MIVDFDPIALTVFGFGVHWYGIMYLLSFVLAWVLARRRAKRADLGWQTIQVDDLAFYVMLGVILGGRFGYVLFYNLEAFLSSPSLLFQIWKGGMSFHGGLLGVLVALWLLNRKYPKGFFTMLDFVAPVIPVGLFFGRIGNFINGELWGKVTDVPWAMVFPHADNLLRHPNPLYEAFLEGIVMFIVLWWYSSVPRPTMAVAGLFCILYGSFRFLIEFVRVPDAHINYLAFDWLTMGQVLSLPLFVAGIVLVVLVRRGETT